MIKTIAAITLLALTSPSSWAQTTFTPAVAAPFVMKGSIVQAKEDAPSVVGGVKWDSETFDVIEKADPDGTAVYTTEIRGHVSDPKKSFIANFRPLKIAADGGFSIKLTVDKDTTPIAIKTILENGTLENANYALIVPDWKLVANRAKLFKRDEPKRWAFNPGLGLTSVTYTQTNTDVGTLTPIMLTFKLGVDYRFKTNDWVIGFVGFMNLMSITPVTATTGLQFLGLNFRVGKKTSWLKTPWELSLSGGVYYLTMMTTGNFGFQNVAGPQFYPTLRRVLGNGGAIATYFKFSPISQGFALMSFTNFEIATGLHYQFPKNPGKLGYSLGVDLSQLAITTVDQNGNTGSANSQTISLALTVSF